MLSEAALLLIDVQKGLDDPVWGMRNNPDAEANIAQLIDAWRTDHRPVIHVQHCSTNPASPLRESTPGHAFKPEATPLPGETVLRKSVNSAFIGTALESHLRNNGIEQLVIAGLTTDHCVSSTVRMAANLGFATMLVGDACATFERSGPNGEHHSAEAIHDIHLASLAEEFCNVVTTAWCLADKT